MADSFSTEKLQKNSVLQIADIIKRVKNLKRFAQIFPRRFPALAVSYPNEFKAANVARRQGDCLITPRSLIEFGAAARVKIRLYSEKSIRGKIFY